MVSKLLFAVITLVMFLDYFIFSYEPLADQHISRFTFSGQKADSFYKARYLCQSKSKSIASINSFDDLMRLQDTIVLKNIRKFFCFLTTFNIPQVMFKNI